MQIKKVQNYDRLLSITKYIVEKHNVTKSIKIQKVLYFLYLEYLKEKSKKMFVEEFEAWIYGPVLPKVFVYIKNNGFNFSEIFNDDNYIEEIVPLESEETKEFIDEKIIKYLKFDSAKLIEMSHETFPWINARKGLSSEDISTNKISFKDLKNYAKTTDFNW